MSREDNSKIIREKMKDKKYDTHHEQAEPNKACIRINKDEIQ